MRFGLFGGTFDPIHRGHLDVVRAARRALALERVSLAPAAVPPHRAAPHAPADARYEMVALAVRGLDGLELSDLDMRSDAPAYTMRTLDALVDRGTTLTDWCVIVGADAFRGIETWYAYPAIIDRCTFVVVSRPGCSVTTLPTTIPALASRMVVVPPSGPILTARDVAHRQSAKPDIVLVDAPTAAVSSTDVRRRRAAGQPIDGLVPGAVEEYIETHGLYIESR